ncbi:PLDc N-terminal domain-containing protein [Cellulomonas xiejunii]|uniref:PLDc N-terminal domain-containing protein n=1 Tax=Cellulomonas xiejunii TaxID=2968083 RepID=A0ABY5KQ92_9CELL|nr:PLDc N-terminal domain-containing protein [Cellulomonas xiejunii]MCC2314352.1 PLDc N-terminal domain-containing protein [Cellulomonas xiejunii]MCC2319715.1 PLDc N-terminal domain-containing protein [Cellulomonas xiejunii]UUI71346.1 PLDc N-terminal domain-containing protein [Cellulomonas xiejunii]
MPLNPKKKWRELRRGQRVGVAVVGAAQVALTAAAYRDLVKRPAAQVNGPKLAWGLALLVNWVGPLAYFAKGRVTS